jgi:hypothetical protein
MPTEIERESIIMEVAARPVAAFCFNTSAETKGLGFLYFWMLLLLLLGRFCVEREIKDDKISQVA